MPTIIAVTKEKKMWIGADSLEIVGGSRKVLGAQRLISYEKNWIGLMGNPSLYLAVNDFLSRSKKKFQLHQEEEIFDFLCHLHRALREDYFLNSAGDNPFESSQCEMLIVNKVGIFKTYELRSVQRFPDYYAIGSGSPYALGALHALYKKERSAQVIVKEAMMIASEFDDSTGTSTTLQSI